MCPRRNKNIFCHQQFLHRRTCLYEDIGLEILFCFIKAWSTKYGRTRYCLMLGYYIGFLVTTACSAVKDTVWWIWHARHSWIVSTRILATSWWQHNTRYVLSRALILPTPCFKWINVVVARITVTLYSTLHLRKRGRRAWAQQSPIRAAGAGVCERNGWKPSAIMTFKSHHRVVDWVYSNQLLSIIIMSTRFEQINQPSNQHRFSFDIRTPLLQVH